jgi:cytochrome c-type biogenesis protein CcmH
MSRIETMRQQLRQVDELAASGVLDAEAAKVARAKLERELVDIVMAGAEPEPASGDAIPAASAAAVAAPFAMPNVAATAASARPSRRMAASLVAFVVVFGAAGYAWRGNADGWSTAPGQVATSAEGATGGQQAPHSTDSAQFQAMVDKLSKRLETKPDDADGWTMLGRSYLAMGRGADAVPAFKKVIDLRPQDAQALADYADALAVVNNRSLDGEPEKLIAKAVKLDPNNVKALFLSGTVAFNHGDFNAAVVSWEHAFKVSEPGSETARQIQGAVDEARQRAGLPPSPNAVAAAPVGGPMMAQAAAAEAPPPATGNGAAPAAAGGGQVSGRVTIDPAIKAGPEDTVFIFARAAQGPKMPLAILRKQVKDLPMDFSLDDSMAMSPAMKLSSFPEVVVGARISKSGNAISAPGDVQGLTAPVKVGAKGLTIKIADVVK